MSSPPDMAAAPRRDQPVVATWLALVALAALLWWLLWRFAHTDRTLAMRGEQIGLFFASFVVYLFAVAVVWRRHAKMPGGVIWLIVAVGIAMRLSLAPVRPVTTSDVYRYLWEARVVRAGENPYRYAPEAPELARLRDGMWRHVQHPRVSAAYPPVAEHVFAFSDALPTDRITTLKLVLALFDIGTVLLLPGLLARVGRPASWALLYAWHPLVVGEVVARGHLDSIGIFFLVAALRLMMLRSRTAGLAAGATFAASVLSKGYAALALPFFLLAAAGRRAAFVGGMTVVTAAACAPFAGAGAGMFRGMARYAQHWQGNASVFSVADWAIARVSHNHDLIARVVCAVFLLAWLAYLAARVGRGRHDHDLLDGSFLALAGLFILSPVVYPWYLAWTVPFMCAQPRAAWLLLTGTIFGFYAHDFAGHHVEIWWVTVLEYGVPVMVWAALALQAGRERAKSVISAGEA